VTSGFAHWMIMAGRTLMGGFYVVAGVHHFFLLNQLTQMINALNIPAPKFVLVTGSLFQTVTGLLLVFGVWQLWAATGLIVFTLTASVMLLNFWNQTDVQRRNSITQWKCNLALIGGLLSLGVSH
jgi:putative oxidoreductase